MATKAKKPATKPTSLFDRVREILESARVNVARTVNTTQVIANWLIGREIVEEEQHGKQRADYGERVVAQLSSALTAAYGSGWSVQNLFYMRQFYLGYLGLMSDAAIHHAARGQSETPALAATNSWQPGLLHPNLSWTHYRTLLKVGRRAARDFYEIEAIQNAWSSREMERQISSLLFDRLAKSRDKKGLMRLAVHGQEVSRPIDVLKDPVVLEFLDLPASPRLVESKLEQALISNLQTFLQELGKGFAFVSRQERITLDGDHFYIDLVFYHTILKCFVLIDLKVGKLTHADLGQIQFYVNYYDRERCTEGDIRRRFTTGWKNFAHYREQVHSWVLYDNSGGEPIMIEWGRTSMIQQELSKAKDPDLIASLAAMKRAADTARKIAMQTSTAIVIVKDRRVVRVTHDELRYQDTE